MHQSHAREFEENSFLARGARPHSLLFSGLVRTASKRDGYSTDYRRTVHPSINSFNRSVSRGNLRCYDQIVATFFFSGQRISWGMVRVAGEARECTITSLLILLCLPDIPTRMLLHGATSPMATFPLPSDRCTLRQAMPRPMDNSL